MTGVTQHAAALNGTIDPKGSETTYHFDYGPTATYGLRTADAKVPAGGAKAVSALLANLQLGKATHVRLVASNAGGTAKGADVKLSTLGRLAPRVTIAISGRDTSFPYRYTVRGEMRLPAGVAKAEGCKGFVAV